MYAYQFHGGESWVKSRDMEGGGGRGCVSNDGGAGVTGKQEGKGEGSWVSKDCNDTSLRKKPKFLKNYNRNNMFWLDNACYVLSV